MLCSRICLSDFVYKYVFRSRITLQCSIKRHYNALVFFVVLRNGEANVCFSSDSAIYWQVKVGKLLSIPRIRIRMHCFPPAVSIFRILLSKVTFSALDLSFCR